MATAAQLKSGALETASHEELVDQLYGMLEDHFDELGFSEEERFRRYTSAADRVTAENEPLSNRNIVS